MTFMKHILSASALVAVTMVGNTVSADPAIIFDLGGKFDKSFNEAAYNGAEKYKKETGESYREFELQSEAQREQALRRFAESGDNPIVVTGFSYGSAMETVAPEFPDTKFVIIDMVVDAPNVRSVVFREDEGSYLVGMLAAMASKTGKVGFVGGMDIPLIRKFSCGFVQGVKAVNPDAEIFENMTGTTGAAWNDPVKGSELAKSQMDRGADVIYHAAGGTGVGVMQAAADGNILSIGVDSNQNYIHPGKVLTSMLKRVDTAVYNSFKDVKDGAFVPGVQVLGLKEGGVGWALDEHNEALITDEMKTAVDAASEKISSGEIKVHDYMSNEKCSM